MLALCYCTWHLQAIDLNEYLREIKFCTGQESVDVVQRKKIFNDKNHYLFTYLKNVSSGRMEVVIVSIIFLSMLCVYKQPFLSAALDRASSSSGVNSTS